MTAVAAPVEPVRRLIVCADDFALHAGVSQGVLELAKQGAVSATSALVLSPRWPQDALRLRELSGRLDVGLHLDWTSDFACAQGHGRPLTRLMAHAQLGRLRAEQARPVIERQLDAFEAHWQAPPDHVDGHQHVQQFAGIRDALVQVLQARYGGAQHRPYLRVSRPSAGTASLKHRLIAGMGADALEIIATKAGLTRAGKLFGIYGFEGDGVAYARSMAFWLGASPDGALLMCHPAAEAPPTDRIGAARQREMAYLASPAWPQALAHAGIRLARGVDALA